MTDDQPDPHELPTLRTCANCACFAGMLEDGNIVDITARPEAMRVCRRNPPGARYQRVEVPVMHNGAAVVIKGVPRMEAKQVLQIGFPPTIETATCWDGWRPAGTLPGVRWESQRMIEAFLPMLEKALVQSGISRQQAHEMGRAMLTGIMPPRNT